MSFSRALAPAAAPAADALTAAMVGIGMNFASAAAPDANIEDTLLFASATAMEQQDLRVLAVLVTWFGVHHPFVNAARLGTLVAARGSTRVHGLWSALGEWRQKDRRFARLAALYRGSRLDLLPTGTEFHLRRHGEDARFAGSVLRVPATVLRHRPADVLTPPELARRHRAYRWRVIMGPTYRADVWAALEADPTLAAAALARMTYTTFATAWQVKRDHALLTGGGQYPRHGVLTICNS